PAPCSERSENSSNSLSNRLLMPLKVENCSPFVKSQTLQGLAPISFIFLYVNVNVDRGLPSALRCQRFFAVFPTTRRAGVTAGAFNSIVPVGARAVEPRRIKFVTNSYSWPSGEADFRSTSLRSALNAYSASNFWDICTVV